MHPLHGDATLDPSFAKDCLPGRDCSKVMPALHKSVSLEGQVMVAEDLAPNSANVQVIQVLQIDT